MCFEKLAGSSIVGPSLLIGNLPRAPKHHWQIEIGKNGRKSVNSQNSGFYIGPKNSQVLEASKSLSSFGSLEYFPAKSLSFAFVIQLQIFQKVKIKFPKKQSLNFVCIQAALCRIPFILTIFFHLGKKLLRSSNNKCHDEMLKWKKKTKIRRLLHQSQPKAFTEGLHPTFPGLCEIMMT